MAHTNYPQLQITVKIRYSRDLEVAAVPEDPLNAASCRKLLFGGLKENPSHRSTVNMEMSMRNSTTSV